MSLLVNPIPRRQPIRRGLGLLGDSFSGNCHTIAATAFGTEAYGYAGWIAARTGLFPSYVDNQGKLGDHTGQFLARLPACIASSTADLWLLLSRTNDSTTAGMSLADTKANVMKIVMAFLNTPGKYLIVGTGTPRFGSRALTGQALADAIAYKDWVLSYVSQFVPVVNIWDGFIEAMTVEGLHPNLLGAEFISSRVVPIITANFEFPGIPLPTDAGDIYSAIRPFGCLNANPLLSGTGGTLPAGVNAVAGSVLADGYKAVGSGLTGMTTRWYKEPAAYGEAQCIELRGNMAAAGGYIYMQPTANVVQTNLAAGDVIEMVSAVEIDGSSRGILAWEAELTITKTANGASSTSYYRSMDKYQEPFTMPASFSGALETQRGTIDLNETVITSRMDRCLAVGVPQGSTVKVAQFGICKV
ncbi:SGNH/GDSL hydrolase family protein [Pseudomonas syringae]|uniref:SGNH/GDSL hydrolase family protein n=1 Tax=Pseudomonas syringae TaxID=317 RepID=UPI0018E61246|nr:SGNH/GDSL hydrolase family protein [Pseudomonas syringae]MBI6749701.1 SGNH/GDSL hydrolase family protein [Pseudomonas syringae]MBI6771854.1 SGNH/GDSL hydrolase family protein [Pseudomonas syringae]MBI6775161.1 SGNH/GDSL hydrolase family protein [Pseudomonas syringae]MBI6793070.1 SGNH/GDSL hydrolase family protein [Pseudomonas syringae]MBI6800271.1 SGNH/GDSL hydrolase family protein [Pseudomonas syringae]